MDRQIHPNNRYTLALDILCIHLRNLSFVAWLKDLHALIINIPNLSNYWGFKKLRKPEKYVSASITKQTPYLNKIYVNKQK